MKRGNKVILLLVAFLISFFIDKEVFYLVKEIRSNILNELFLSFTFLTSTIVIFFVLTSIFLYHDHRRRWIIPLWLTLIIESILIFIIKIIIKRPRPYIEGTISTLSVLASNSHKIWDFAFPSFHAAIVFSAIPFISKEFPKLKIIWIVLAFLTAFSRVYFGLHYFSDIFIGAVIGYFLGTIITKQEQKHKFGLKIYNKIKSKF